jgi:iron complex transport system substrate-binding protein
MPSEHTAPTRRDTLKYGATAAATLGLAGCSDTAEQAGGNGTPTGTAMGSWEVTIEPSGTRTFSEVPETYTVYHSGWADIMAALGQFDGLRGMQVPSEFFPSEFYERLPGVDIDLSNVVDLFGGGDSVDKELFYELDPDISMIDPNVATDYLGFDEGDVDELTENVAPFFGSFMRRPQYTDQHPYYTLYEGTERAAQVFREQSRYESLKGFHDEVMSDITARVPDAGDRPSYAYMNMNWWGEFNEVYARKARIPGYQHKPFRDLNVASENNAFQSSFADGKRQLTTDLEGLLEADPEVIIWHGGYNLIGGYSPGWYDGGVTWEDDIVGALQDDPVASEVTAVQEGQILPGNIIEAGPVTNLFNTEDIAKQLYPEEFGAFHAGEYGESEQLFDRQRLADIINGDLDDE